MKKVTWLLGLSLLLGGGSVFAQEGQQNVLDVAVPSSQIKQASDLRSVFNYLQTTLPELKTTLDSKQQALNAAQSTLNNTMKDKVDYKTTTADAQEAKEYDAFAASTIYSDGKFGDADIYYYTVTSEGNPLLGGTGEAVVYFVAPSLKEEVGAIVGENKLLFLNLSKTTDYTPLNLSVNINRIYIYYKNFSENQESIETLTLSTMAGNYKNVALVAGAYLESVSAKIPKVETVTEVKRPNPDYTYWEERIKDLNEEILPYQKKVLEANTLQNISIENDIQLGTESFATYTWPADYKIDGGYHKISGSGGENAILFATNSGQINNLIVSTGRIADTNSGKITNSIGRLSSGGYRVYDEDGKATKKSSLVDAAYALRTIYGYDFATGDISKINKEGSNKLYQAKYADVDHKNLYEFKTNILPSGSLKYDDANFSYRTTENAITYIEDADATDATGYASLENVAVKKSNGYVCENTVMVEGAKQDGSDTKSFYIPEDFVAKKLTYMRNFTQANATACLPFNLTKTLKEALGIKYLHQFLDVRDEGFAFSWELEVPANTPCLIQLNSETSGQVFNISSEKMKELTGGDGLYFKATTGELKEKYLYGTYTRQTIGNLISRHKGEKVYTTQDNKLVLLTEEVKDFPFDQFRAYVAIPASEVDAPSYRMILLDEDGNEMDTTTDVKSVATDKDNFNVAGGNNAIEISTEKACDVKVYTVNGTLVKSAHVEAGNTSLPVKAGVYVVNGTKVIVK